MLRLGTRRIFLASKFKFWKTSKVTCPNQLQRLAFQRNLHPSIKVRRGFCHEQCSYKILLGLGKIYKNWFEKLPYLCKTTRMSLYLGMLLQKKHTVCAIYKRKTSSSLLKLLNFTYTHFLGKIQVLGTLLV